MLFALAALALSPLQAASPDRYPVWKWGGTAPKSLGYWADRGFTSVGAPMISGPIGPEDKVAKDIRAILDSAPGHGLEVGLYLNPLLDPRWKSDPAVQAVRHDGSKLPIPYPRDARVLSYAQETASSALALFKGSPAWRNVLLGSEFQLDYNFSSAAAELGKREAGVDVRAGAVVRQPAAQLPQDGIVEGDNPRLKFLRWWFHRGMGDAEVNRSMAAILESGQPGLSTWHDPYRLFPASDAAAGLDAVSTWTYAQPDMTRLLYTRVLQAAARRGNQKAFQTITLFLYPRFVEAVSSNAGGSLENDKPGASDYYTAGPDFAREATWLVFSQRPDGIAYYFGGRLQPDDPNVDKGRASPETFDAIGEVVRELVEPYGPTLLAGRPAPAKTAVLLSATAINLGGGPKNVGYPNEQILPVCSLLAMNHVPFEVVFDEDVLEGRLSRYEVLVMPQARAVTRSMRAKLAEFAAGGGKIVADKGLTSTLSATRVDFDFSFQSQVDGVALSQGKSLSGEENRRRMDTKAKSLAEALPRQRPFATADSPRAIVNVVEAGDLKFVFVVNDNRGYGPRFGTAKLHLEKLLPLKARVTIDASGPIYDAMSGGRMAGSSFEAVLPATGGRLFAVLTKEPPEPSVDAATLTAKVGIGAAYPARLTLKGPDGNVVAVQSVRSTGGGARLAFALGPQHPKGTYTLSVLDLVTRKSSSVRFQR